jgi:nitrite reductase (cytochrome c-552)
MRNRAMDALVALIADLKAAKAAGAPDGALAEPRQLQRKAQFYLDFVEAENSTGFHAPQEALRILDDRRARPTSPSWPAARPPA